MMPTTPTGSRVTSMSTFGRTRGEFLAGNSQGLAGEEVEDLAGPHDFADGFGQRLALFASEQAAEFVAPRQDFCGCPRQDVVPLLRRRARPCRKGGVGGRDRGVSLSGVGLRIFADDVVRVRRIDVSGDADAIRPNRRR